MTCKISRSVFAFALALGMLAALSNPSRAALSTADRTNAVAIAPAPEQATVAAVSAQQPATVATTPAPATVAATPAPATVAAAAPVAQPRKIVAPRATPRRVASVASFAPRGGYPCH
jgi:hypothetical protein